MKKHKPLTPLLSNQIKSYLKMLPKNESLQIYPANICDALTQHQLGFTKTSFGKILNKLVNLNYGSFENQPGAVYFELTQAGCEWLEEAD